MLTQFGNVCSADVFGRLKTDADGALTMATVSGC